MKKLLSITLCLLLLLSLTACGAAPRDVFESANGDAYGGASDKLSSGEMSSNAAPQAPDGATQALPQGRKWVITMEMQAETEDLRSLLEELNAQVAALGGYTEDSSIHQGSTYSGTATRYARLTLRVPADRLEEFTAQVDQVSNVVSSSRSLEDVTLSYVSTESRRNALLAEEARLLEFMAQAKTVEELLAIEDRLTDVQYELEAAVSKLRVYDNLVDFATVTLRIDEVKVFTPVEEEEPTFWARVSTGFVANARALWNGLLELVILLAANLPTLLVLAAIVLIIVLLCRRSARRRKAARPPQPPRPPYPPPCPAQAAAPAQPAAPPTDPQ